MAYDRVNEKQFTCIMCPLGCSVTVKTDDKGGIVEVLGNKCKKGDKYARDEYTQPMRVLTSTVSIEGAPLTRLPVRTTGPIPKDKLLPCMHEVMIAKAVAPVKMGDKLIENLLGLGVDLIATRDLP